MRVLWGVFTTILLAASANAQQAGRVRLADVIAEAVANHPEIAAAHRRHDAARQRPVQEHSLPDPMISAGYSANGAPWPGAGLGTGNLTKAIDLLKVLAENRVGTLIQASPDRWARDYAQLARLYRKANRESEAYAIDAHLLKLLTVSDVDNPLLRELHGRMK